jgi:hypothetical protein
MRPNGRCACRSPTCRTMSMTTSDGAFEPSPAVIVMPTRRHTEMAVPPSADRRARFSSGRKVRGTIRPAGRPRMVLRGLSSMLCVASGRQQLYPLMSVLYRTAAAQRPLLVVGQEPISERIERPCAYNLHRARQIIAPAIFIATLRFLGIAAFTSPKPRNSTMMMELASDVASVLTALPKLESRDDHHFFPERGMERTISDRRQHRTSTASQRLSNRVVYRSAIVRSFLGPQGGRKHIAISSSIHRCPNAQ